MDKQAPLTHIQPSGQPGMVNISQKQATLRRAVASGSIRLPKALKIEKTAADILSKKGPIIHTAIVAGTQAVKRTAEFIPFCHPLPIEAITFTHEFQSAHTLVITCSVECHYKTGVEMEALTGVSTALLTVYDMCKSAGQDMLISDIQVVQKSGGKSDLTIAPSS